MTWIEGEVGTVQNIQCLQSDGTPRDLTGASAITLEVRPAARLADAATSLTGAVVDATSGRMSYTRVASDLTVGTYKVRVKHTAGSNIGYSRYMDLEVVPA